MKHAANDYEKFYQLLKKVNDGFQRGLSEAQERNRFYEQEIEELKKELMLSKQINKYLQSSLKTHAKGRDAEIKNDLSALLDMEAQEVEGKKHKLRPAVNKNIGKERHH